MTTVHARIVGDQALLTRADLDRLVDLARRSEEIHLQSEEDDLPGLGTQLLAEKGGAFDWLADEPDLYSLDDLKVRYL